MELVSNSAATQPAFSRFRKDARSAVTNGERLHVERPGNTAWARRFRDVLEQIIADLLTNNDTLSEGQKQLARRAATIAIVCEKMEGEAAAGNDIDLDRYGSLTDRFGRTFHRLGLKRSKPSQPSLHQYLQTVNASKQT